jgi:predicted TIM-barrel fold metal-dependent hydrolase
MALLHIAGTIDRCTGLRICLSHGGGAFLWLWPRFGQIASRSGASATLPNCLHVDTAGIVRENLDYVMKFVPRERVLFGSDMPATVAGAVAGLLATLAADDDVRAANVERFLTG